MAAATWPLHDLELRQVLRIHETHRLVPRVDHDQVVNVPLVEYSQGFHRQRILAVGLNPAYRTEAGFDKVVGDLGVFATFRANRAAFGIPNASSGRESAEPFTDSEDVNNKAVLDYFVYRSTEQRGADNAKARTQLGFQRVACRLTRDIARQ